MHVVVLAFQSRVGRTNDRMSILAEKIGQQAPPLFQSNAQGTGGVESRRKAFPGDWIIEGENHERYIVDNPFFQRPFAPIPWEPSNEGRNYGC